jgi:hypothetical protein
VYSLVIHINYATVIMLEDVLFAMISAIKRHSENCRYCKLIPSSNKSQVLP